MDLNKLQRVYFIGVGGIGMSALARYFNSRNVAVLGYDRAATPLTKALEGEGIKVHYSDDATLVDKEADLIVYTPAIPAQNAQLAWYKQNDFAVHKRSEVLQWITQSMFAITVAGTHGKTTISTMIAYLLRETEMGCNAFLGGISSNYQTNYWSGGNDIAVIEADEYDRSFLKLYPDIALLTSMDADHLDIYGTEAEMEQAFIQYTGNIKPNGTLLVKHGLKRGEDLKGANKIHYSLQNDAADAYAANIVQKQGGYVFDAISQFGIIENMHLQIGGMHNVENAVAAITVLQMLKVEPAKIKAALENFKGVKRRFEYIFRNQKTVFIDDYAHHPEELESLIRSAKKLFPGKKCVVAFQPHLYSRTRDLATGFANSLDMADEVLLLEIYPARETEIPGVSSKIIAEKMGNPNHTILSKQGLLDYVRVAPIELFITAGAGDIDQLVNPIKEIIETK